MEIDETDRDQLERQINSATTKSLDRLFELWTTIGIKNLRENRLDAVLGHIKTIYGTMIEEEEANLDKITKNIEKYDRARMELRRDLGLLSESDDSDEAELSLVDVDYKIRTEVTKLKEMKEERMKVFNDVRAAEKILCDSTGIPPCEITYDRMPTNAHVRQIEKHISHLRDVRGKRENEFESTTDKIRELYERLEIEPRDSKERHLICNSVSSIVLSQDTMDSVQLILGRLETEMQSNCEEAREIIDSIKSISEKLNLPCDLASKQRPFYSCRVIEELREELKCLEEERKKHMAVFIKSAADELDQIWTKCYADKDAKRTFEAILATKDDEESQLTHYESNIKAWKKYFDEHCLIFNKINEWNDLWKDRVQLEGMQKDPSRLGNFKALREEEKMRNRVNKKLPKVIEEIKALMANYAKTKGKEFLVLGMTFEELNEDKMARHEMAVAEEKERKKNEKKKLMVQESIYGVAKTPSRGGNRTLRQVKRLQHDSKTSGKSFATPGKPTPGRRALRDRNNDTFVSGSHLPKDSIASVNDNIFNNAEVASSTLKAEQIRPNLPTPIKKSAMSSIKKYNTMSGSVNRTRSRTVKNTQKIPFLL